MKTPEKIKTNKKASAIILAVFAIVILFLIGLALLSLGFNSRMTAIRTTAQISARCAADAGITQAIKLMNKKIEDEVVWNNSTLPSAADVVIDESTNASFSFTVTGNPTAGFQIDSEGKLGQATKTIHTLLRIGSIWETSINLQDEAIMNNGIQISQIPSDCPFTLRTNSTADNAIILKAGVTIPGDIIVGPGGVPSDVIDTKQTTEITGQTYPAAEPMIFPPVLPPTGLPNMVSISASSPAQLNSGEYSSIEVSDSLTVNGNCTVYVTGPFILKVGGSLITPPGSSLNLYLGGNLESKNSVGMDNQTNDATALKIYGLPTCTQIDIKAKSGLFYGAVYAPNAILTMFNSSEIFGAFACDSVILKNSCNFHYICELGNVGINDPTATIKPVRWWEP